jgi:pimeloyl-ACP methyl ester carboxylesterase
LQSLMMPLVSGPQSRNLELLRGGEGPPLLFLHAIDGTEGAKTLLEKLAQRFTVYAPSHPGFGASSRPPELTTTGDLAYFYLDLFDQLDLHDITLVGASFGGWIGSEIMVRDCAHISRAVLAGPLGLLQTLNKQNVLLDVFSLPGDAWPAAFCADPSHFLAPQPGMNENQLLRIARNQEAAALYGWSPYMANAKLAQRLHRVKKPTLLISGDNDRIAPADYGIAYAKAIPGAQHQIARDCGHLIHADDPQALAERIFAFCSREIA